MYNTGDCVVYGIHGVCRVVGFEKQLVNRKRTEYMVLEPVTQSESRYYLPTANAVAMAKLRDVMTRSELEGMLSSDRVRSGAWIQEENERKLRYRELIAGGDREALMTMVFALYRYRREQTAAGKKFHLCDENFLRDAERLLASEIALVLDMTPEAARDYLREQVS